MWLFAAAAAAEVVDGDLVFHRSTSAQATFLEAATGSPLTHVGVVTVRDGAPFVFEAGDPVGVVPLRAWAGRAADGKIAIRRVEAGLSPEAVKTMEAVGRGWLGKRYDVAFSWTDDRMYCSELVHKLFLAAGVELGTPHPLGDFDLSDPAVRKAAERRWGTIPVEEPVVAPVDVYRDDDLVTVCEGAVEECLRDLSDDGAAVGLSAATPHRTSRPAGSR